MTAKDAMETGLRMASALFSLAQQRHWPAGFGARRVGAELVCMYRGFAGEVSSRTQDDGVVMTLLSIRLTDRHGRVLYDSRDDACDDQARVVRAMELLMIEVEEAITDAMVKDYLESQ